ncbi:anhydro-N-acetylmuramic acid kinase [Gangjinia marincola]|uniref:Anhydro-N-acetylmuramic acid kinase n=2 Tax=Gangjinia marincola TaxID=578463 RepID=A0ABN1MIK3_9FLAO
MSGTSLDGLDLVCCTIEQQNDVYSYTIIASKEVPYTPEWKKKLSTAPGLSAIELLHLHNEYGTWLGEQTKLFIHEKDLKIDAVSSHGHTVHHLPDSGLTFQLGSGQHIANACQHRVICDFRTLDVALCGQGAPLVPIGDELLFSTYNFCLNLGGIANVSFKQNEKRIAYDIGIANMLLNYLSEKQGEAYDQAGESAKSGQINQTLLEQLNKIEYYKKNFPKSTGYEWFAAEIIPLIEQTKDSIPNLLHTSVHHIADQIAAELLRHQTKKTSTVLVTGGGAFNTFLIDTLQKKAGHDIRLKVPNNELITCKEALVFALMGMRRLEGKVNCLRSVTGAKRDSCSGVIYQPA